MVSHLSAALMHGWPVALVPDLPHVTVPPDRPRADDPLEVAVLHIRHLHPSDHAAWSTNPLRTVLDCARDLPFAEALAVADSALRMESVTRDQLLDATARMHGPAGEMARRVAAYSDGKAANPFESVLRAHCIEAGLEVIPQHEVTCGLLTLHPDLANPLLGIVVEADSYTRHGMRKTDFFRDCERYNALTATGWRVLRFTWDQVMDLRDYVMTTVRATMAEAAA